MKTLLALLLLLNCVLFTEAKQPNKALIASYLWPTDPQWTTLLSAITTAGLSKSRVYFVINANNGIIGNQTTGVKALWKSLAKDTLKHVGKVLCYINLCNKVPPFPSCGEAALQGARPAAETLQYVDDWIDVVGVGNIAGFFLDDTPMDGRNGDNIKAIIAGIKERKSRFKIFTNPGVAATDTELISLVTATVYDEGPLPDSDPSPKVFKNGVDGFGRNKFAMILHSVPEDKWAEYAETARKQYYGFFYATSAAYEDIPPYINDLMARIAE